MSGTKLVLLLFLILLHECTLAQFESLNDDWRWVQFTTESGLPSNHVLDVVESSDGTPWVATASGIAWYDGFRWTSVLDSLAYHKGAIYLSATDRGDILVTTGDKLFRCTKREAHQIDQNITGKAPGSLLAADGGGGKIFFEVDGRVFLQDSGRVDTFDLNLEKYFLHFIQTKNGGLWINTLDGLYTWNGEKWIRRLKASNTILRLTSLVENEQNRGMVSVMHPAEDRGLWEWDGDNPITFSRSEGGELVSTMDISATGEALAVYESGTVRAKNNDAWYSLTNVPQQLSNISVLKFRGNGDLWVGSERGLYLCRRSLKRWTYWKHPFPSLKNNIHEILKTRNGNIVLATVGGIEIRTPGGTITKFEQIDGTKLLTVTGLCEDNNGDIWVSSGSTFAGVYRWNGVRWRHYDSSDGLSAKFIHKIRKDEEGNLWFLGIGDGDVKSAAYPGAFVYDGLTFKRWGEPEGLTSGWVYDFVQTADSSLWFATRKGLSRWKLGEWTRWDTTDGALLSTVFSLDVGPEKKQAWFGLRPGGVGWIDEQDKLRVLNVDDGLIDNNVWDLRFDALGRLWVATRGGLSMYDNGGWANFQRSSGLNNLKLWPLLPERDRVFIGTDGNGVDILSFDEMRNPPPKIVVEKPVVDGNDVACSWHAYGYWGEMSDKEIPTRYKVDDTQWSPWSQRRSLLLSNLGVGEHHVRVQAKGLFGKYDSAGGYASFTIIPPLYLRPVFVLPLGVLVILLICVGTLSVIRKRQHLRSLVAYQEQLRSLTSELSLTEDRERKRVASYLHDNIAQALIFCKLKLGSLGEAARSSKIVGELSEVEKMLDESIEKTRQLTLEMSPPILAELSFGDALEWLSDRFQDQHALTVKFSDDDQPKPLDEDIRSVLFLAVREALTNVVKHARATIAEVSLRRNGDSVQISVRDNGIGFGPNKSFTKTLDGSGFGLFNMRERLAHFGGQLDIDANPGNGARLTLTAPLQAKPPSGDKVR